MHFLLLIALFFIFLASGCASSSSIVPVTNGSVSDLPGDGSSTVVWGQHKGAVAEIITMLQQYGLRVVERSRLQQVLAEQKIKLTYSGDDEAQILNVGKILGAGSIVFVDVEASSSLVSHAFVNRYGGSSGSQEVTNLSVSVRGVNVETSEVMWTGTAHYPQAVTNPEAGIIYLTQRAVLRGLCPVWKSDTEGCDQANEFGIGTIGYDLESRNSPAGIYLVISSILQNSQAEQLGFKIGDIIVSCDGKSGFRSKMQLLLTCKHNAGQTIIYQIRRGDKLTSISATASSHTERKH